MLALRTGGRWAIPTTAPGAAGPGDVFPGEVLNTQPPALRDFLRTSIVDHLWPELAVELTSRRDAPKTLARLAHSNAFWYRAGTATATIRWSGTLLRAQLNHESPIRAETMGRG